LWYQTDSEIIGEEECSLYCFGTGGEFLDFLGDVQSGKRALKVEIVLKEFRVGVTEFVNIARSGY
jgi:hypothetical protein